MLFSSAAIVESVECGTVFRAAIGLIEEKAEVLSISKDGSGIPHVKFQLEVKRGCSTPSVEQRTLALDSFRARYREKV